MVNTSLTLDPSRINTYSIGFDRMFDSLMGQTPMTTNYPPYNIVKHSDDKYTIEIAVAGFSKDDIAVETKAFSSYHYEAAIAAVPVSAESGRSQ